jgi:hypothetical protein
MNKVLSYILSILALVSILFGSYTYIDNRYALSSEVDKIKMRLDYKIVSDQLSVTQERLWKIEDRYKGKEMDITTKEEYRKLQQSKVEAEQRLKTLQENRN